GRPLLLVVERGSEVVVEPVSARGDPREAPAEPVAIGGELLERRARDRDERDVPGLQVDDIRVEAVGPERATRAALVVLRPGHDVVEDELAPPVEELGEGLPPLRRVEDVLPPDALPREIPLLPAQLVAQPRELFLPGEQRPPRLDPLVVTDDLHATL